MTSVFNLLFDLFESVIGFMKKIPLTQNVSLFDFSIAILIMSIIIVAFVPIVQVGSTNYVNETLENERIKQREIDKVQKEIYKNSYLNYRSNRMRNEEYNRAYNEEKKRGIK